MSSEELSCSTAGGRVMTVNGHINTPTRWRSPWPRPGLKAAGEASCPYCSVTFLPEVYGMEVHFIQPLEFMFQAEDACKIVET